MNNTSSILYQNHSRRIVIRIYLRITYCELANMSNLTAQQQHHWQHLEANRIYNTAKKQTNPVVITNSIIKPLIFAVH